jgi:MFS family permease
MNATLEDAMRIRKDCTQQRLILLFGSHDGPSLMAQEKLPNIDVDDEDDSSPFRDQFDDDILDDADGALLMTDRNQRSTGRSSELFTVEEERNVVRKLDTRLVLFVALLYLISFVDRSNIGNARLAGLVDDLQLSNDDYEWLLTSFYLMYILFEWMTICYRLFPAHIYISCCVCAWGVVASLQAIVTNFPSLIVLRALLGIGEAAFVGVPVYLSFFFKREELAFRTGLFISAAPLATSFASSLAYAIMSLGDAAGGVAKWRLLFLIEGFPACLIAMWAWDWLPDGPESISWLSHREQEITALRMRSEAKSSSTTSSNSPRHKQPFQWSHITHTLSDPKAWLAATTFFACNVAFSSMPVFLPTIVSAMGFSARVSQGLSAPPFLFAFVIVLGTAVLSDRMRDRSRLLMAHACLAALGYAILVLPGIGLDFGPVIRYMAVFPICAGFFSAVTLLITWTVNNQRSDEGKSAGVALLNVIGQMGPLLGTRLYPDREGPFYLRGMVICAIAMISAAILTGLLRVLLKRDNDLTRSRQVGNRAPAFLYLL